MKYGDFPTQETIIKLSSYAFQRESVDESVFRVYKAWKKGIVQVETLKGGAIRYCANYLVDVTVQKNDDDIEKQFALMSKKPPIGYQYYSDKAMLKYHRQKVNTITLDGKKIKTIDFDFAHYTNENGTFGLPRLYRNKIYTKLEQLS